MQTYLFRIIAALSLIAMMSCEEDYGTFLEDSIPEYPIIFPNATTYGFNPFIEVPLSDGTIEFVLALPEDTDASISEISRVAIGGTGINAADLTEANNYLSAPIQSSNDQATFTTTIAEYEQFASTEEDEVVVEAGDELGVIFLVELSNGQEIVTTQVRAKIIE